MLCGLVGSLPILTGILALSAVAWSEGVNVIKIVQVELCDTIPPHVPPPVTAKSLAFSPLGLPSLTDSENADRLVTVMGLVFGDVLAVRVPNASVTGVTVAGMFAALVNET